MAEEQLPEADRVAGHPHPRETEHLIGQKTAERAFLDAWASGRLHHAWLLRGPRGVGKSTLAYRIARALLAEQPAGALFGSGPAVPQSLDPPEGCSTRTRILARAEPRLFVLRREVNDKGLLQTQIPVDRVRAVRSFLHMSAADGGWRVVIVDPADEMNVNAANALLKYLEEPPSKTVFLLLSHAPAGLLPTIRSRCRTLDLAPLAPEALAQALAASSAVIADADRTALAELSAGSVGEALRLVAGDGLATYRGIVSALGPRGVDRAKIMALSAGVGGRAGAERYRLVIGLTLLLLARLARAAATGAPPHEAVPGEAALIAATASTPAQAGPWADALAKLSERTRHATAVNLDPAQVVIDMFLELDATLAEVRSVAA
ncbi:MAG: DNA polymerase III subunit delta' [Pseudomonadota bacterium]